MTPYAARVYVDRITRGGRHYRHPRGDFVADAGEDPRKRVSRHVPGASQGHREPVSDVSAGLARPAAAREPAAVVRAADQLASVPHRSISAVHEERADRVPMSG